jgi:uncharacterized protein
MFGISFAKILLLAVVITVVWYGFRHVGGVRPARQSGAVPRSGAGRGAGIGTGAGAARVGEAEDMVKCPGCGAYVTVHGARNCGREACPYPG